MSRNICLICLHCLHSQTACHCYGARCTCLARRKSGWSWRLPKSSGGGPWIARVAPLGMRSSHSKTLITLKTWQWWSVSRCGGGSKPIIINSNGMNIHLPAILGFTRSLGARVLTNSHVSSRFEITSVAAQCERLATWWRWLKLSEIQGKRGAAHVKRWIHVRRFPKSPKNGGYPQVTMTKMI